MFGREPFVEIDVDQAGPQPVTHEQLSGVVTEMAADAGVEDDVVHRSVILGHLTAQVARQCP